MNTSKEYRIGLSTGRWIFARVYGSGPDVPVLLIHGIPGSADAWTRVTRLLSAGHTVVVPDLIGFGKSSRTDDIDALWADTQAAAIINLMEDVGLEQVIVVGHDFGGPVAAHLAARMPSRVAGLVLASTNTFGDTPIPFPLSGILWPGIGRLWEAVLFSRLSLRMMVKQGVGDGSVKPDPAVYVGDPMQALAIRKIFSTALRELAPRYNPIAELLGRVDVPTSVVWGDKDPFFPTEQAYRTAALIPGADVVVIPGAGHFLPDETPTELASEIQAVARRINVPV